jgi:hypothetical protein
MPFETLFALALGTFAWPAAPSASTSPAPRAAAHATASAVDLSGHWEADVTGDGRTFTFLFDFVTKGDTLTGTVGISSREDIFPITEGRIKGNTISFKAFGIWTGTLAGSDLKLTRGLDYGRKQQMTAHRKPTS